MSGRDGGARAQSLTPQSLAGSGSFVLLEKCTSGIGGLKSIQCVIEDKFLIDVGVNIWLQNVSKVSTTLDKKTNAACAIARFCKEAWDLPLEHKWDFSCCEYDFSVGNMSFTKLRKDLFCLGVQNEWNYCILFSWVGLQLVLWRARQVCAPSVESLYLALR